MEKAGVRNRASGIRLMVHSEPFLFAGCEREAGEIQKIEKRKLKRGRRKEEVRKVEATSEASLLPGASALHKRWGGERRRRKRFVQGPALDPGGLG